MVTLFLQINIKEEKSRFRSKFTCRFIKTPVLQIKRISINVKNNQTIFDTNAVHWQICKSLLLNLTHWFLEINALRKKNNKNKPQKLNFQKHGTKVGSTFPFTIQQTKFTPEKGKTEQKKMQNTNLTKGKKRGRRESACLAKKITSLQCFSKCSLVLAVR